MFTSYKGELMNINAELRKQNFRNIIVNTPLIEFHTTQPFNDNEPDALGIQWWSGINTPPTLSSRPDQDYWKTHQITFMLGRKRWAIVIRGKKMPYRNCDEWLNWCRNKFE
jgi:hypothetical protein